MKLSLGYLCIKTMLSVNYALLLVSFMAKCSSGLGESKITNDSTVLARPVLTILWDDYFSAKDFKYDSDEVDKYIPTSIYITPNRICIPNNYSNRIEVFTKDGRLERVISFDGRLIDLGKFYLNSEMDSLFVLDKEGGLFIFNDLKELIYRDEKTVDLILDLMDRNIIFENSSNDQRAILDKKGLMSKPISVAYFNMSLFDNRVYGIKFNGSTFDHPYLIEEVDIVTGVKKEILKKTNDNCDECFMFPKLFGKDFVIAANQSTDYIHFIEGNSFSYSLKIKYPEEFDVIRNFEFADLIYNGFAYHYEFMSKSLYAIGSNHKGITVFKIDLGEKL